ncbi:MAG: 1-deoxy-D-xylulose-5-phosphate reductoisomerase [Bacteroidota bacterium]
MAVVPVEDIPSTPSVRRLSILGSTGSIGTQTLEIVRLFPDRFRVVALVANSNVALLAEQAKAFRPEFVVIAREDCEEAMVAALQGTGIEVRCGEDAVHEAAVAGETVIAAMVGFAGLKPVLAAVRAGRTVALANKETLVVAGELLVQEAKANEATVLPLDSEHSAIFQCLVGEPMERVDRLILTASGGPFRTWPAERFPTITKRDALKHPNWSMGAKVTIDSASLMNKGLEVIEACWLFDLGPDRVDVLVHPQSIVHSMVEFVDGSTKAQLGVPDMKVPIQYALTYPDRWPAPHKRLDWASIRALDFEQPDLERFPALGLAFDALEAGGTMPATLNAANEAAVQLFLDDRIRFMDIPAAVASAMSRDAGGDPLNLDALAQADAMARRHVLELHSAQVN